jgi:hypothetical protein
MDIQEPAKRRRGRPCNDPAFGPKDSARRSLEKRQRREAEITALAGRFYFAMFMLRHTGDFRAVKSVFGSEYGEAALRACRRLIPHVYKTMLIWQAIAEKQCSEMIVLHNEFKPPRSGDGILVCGRTYTIANDGRVKCDGKPTRYLINREYRSWVLVDPSNSGPPRRHYLNEGGRATALKDAACRLAAQDKEAPRDPWLPSLLPTAPLHEITDETSAVSPWSTWPIKSLL